MRAYLPDGNRQKHQGDAVEHGVRQGHAAARELDCHERHGDGSERPWQGNLLRMRRTDVPVQPEGEVRVVEPTDQHDAGKDRGAWAEPPQGRTKAEQEN